MMRLFRSLGLVMAAACAVTPAFADTVGGVVAPADAGASGFPAFLQLLAARARGEGVREQTIRDVISGMTFDPDVVRHDRSQPGGPPSSIPRFEPYRRTHVDAGRIDRGRAMLASVGPLATTVETRYGVPASVVLAIWGHETNYGRFTGTYDLPRSIASLAYEGRRRELFSAEFVALLKMIDRGVPRSRLLGSWAGAFGNPQFLPSVYLRVAQDADGDGIADIWTSRPDTLASIANYFRDAGWRRGEPWGFSVTVPAGYVHGSLATALSSPRCPQVFMRHSRWRTMAEWRALGFAPARGTWPDDRIQATLFEPDGPGHPAYLLTGNYRVILDYNCSNFYALSVGLLADEISR
ncbi:lytic murein transglycosylase [Novosphingobium nitrogenifigens DSM 19370]|uniref:Lytic murein transglycosylase n=1 Tax=Novosphingobium nitrogenifigens DSM 19370 TaxID=983920 RepID=F1Z9X4_9SPHN|nr:lytic murein transglycosylase [Novosphingobium nitrogenifigens DSM 19370]